MKALFKEKSSKFGSLFSLVVVTAMLALFFLTLPEALVSVPGRIFAVVWAFAAILLFIAHARRLAGEQRYRPPYFAEEKDVRSKKKQGERRLMRG